MLSLKEIAKTTGKSESRIRQIAHRIADSGHAVPPTEWQFKESAVEFIKNLPDNRGRKTIKEKIRLDLIKSGIKHPVVWKGYSPRTNENGWHFQEFGSSEDIYIGKSWKDYKQKY